MALERVVLSPCSFYQPENIMPIRMGCLVLLLAVFSCDSASTTGAVCTDIGCDTGLIVELQNAPDVPYRVEAYVSGSSPRYVQTCSSETPCNALAFFRDFIPDHVFIDVISTLGTQRYEAHLTYEMVQPNGPGCDPVCRKATIRLPEDALAN